MISFTLPGKRLTVDVGPRIQLRLVGAAAHVGIAYVADLHARRLGGPRPQTLTPKAVNMRKHIRWSSIGVLALVLLVCPGAAAKGPLVLAATQVVNPHWEEVIAQKKPCSNPDSFCTAKFVDPSPGAGVPDSNQPGRVLYGIVFQQITFRVQWLECGPPPHSQYDNTFQFYEAFPLVGVPGQPVAESPEDTFKAFPFSHEVAQYVWGNAKYVRATASNVKDLVKAYKSLPGKPNQSKHNGVMGANGELKVPAPGGGEGVFETGSVPNGVAPPSAGASFDWSNDFGGTAIAAARWITQMSICCGGAGWVDFQHNP